MLSYNKVRDDYYVSEIISKFPYSRLVSKSRSRLLWSPRSKYVNLVVVQVQEVLRCCSY